MTSQSDAGCELRCSTSGRCGIGDENQTLRVACVTTYAATGSSTSPSWAYYMAGAVAGQNADVEFLGPMVLPPALVGWNRLKQRAYSRLFHQYYTPERSTPLLRRFARQLDRRLAVSDHQVVFSPISPGSQPVAYLDCRQPIVIWTDTTLAAAIDFYPELKKLCYPSVRDGLRNERAALSRADVIVYSSEWAAESAIQRYGLPRDKVKVASFGPCLDIEHAVGDVEAAINARSTAVCRLLFIANQWKRKGGDLAVDVTLRLRTEGIQAELYCVGREPPDEVRALDCVRVVGRLSKSDPRQRAQLMGLLAESNYLILPSTADCTPFVFSEACAFGVPCLTTNVGGIPSVIRDDINGKMFPLGASAEDYCRYISENFQQPERYGRLARSAFGQYRARLNWDVAGRAVCGFMREALGRDGAAARQEPACVADAGQRHVKLSPR